jgi:hypothetical protein
VGLKVGGGWVNKSSSKDYESIKFTGLYFDRAGIERSTSSTDVSLQVALK